MLYIIMAGLRRDEVVSLDLKDFDQKTGTLQVRCGKGGDDRTTYLVGDAIFSVNRWIEARGNEPGPLYYPMTKGKRLVAKRITGFVKLDVHKSPSQEVVMGWWTSKQA